MNKIRHHLLRQVTNLRMRDMASRYCAKNINSQQNFDKYLNMRWSPQFRLRQAKLKESGFSFHEKFDDQRCSELEELARTAYCIDQYRPHLGSFLSAQRPEEARFGSVEKASLLRNDAVREAVGDPEMLSMAAHYLGAVPTVSSIDLWWSYAGHSASDSQQFHRDNTDWKFVKFFVYLTDVDHQSGPHTYALGSHRTNGFSARRRWSDEVVKERLGTDCLSEICGARGTTFFEDTYGLHKGRAPVNRDRLVFQIQYSLSPVSAYKYSEKAPSGQHKYYETRLFYQ